MTACAILFFLVVVPLATVAFVVLIKLVCTVHWRIKEFLVARHGKLLAKAWGIPYPSKEEIERIRKRGRGEGDFPCRKQ